MTAENSAASEPAVRHYGLPDFPVAITDGRVTATVRPWYRFGKRVIVADFSDYVAIGHRIIARRVWFQRFPSYFRQAVLVHKESHFRNIVLGETQIFLGESQMASLALRAMLEKFGKELALPIIDSDRPPRVRRPLMAASPDQVFETRFPDELDWSVRDLVAHGRLTVNRDIPSPPRGVTIERNGSGLRLTFRYSALWETLKIVGYVLTILLIGATAHHHGPSEMQLRTLIIGCGAVTALIFLIVFPLQCFFNGNELLLADLWTYRPATGSLLFPSVQVLSQLRLSEIEEIYRSKRDIVITTDREIVRIRCRSRAMAKWMERALLAVAAYGLSVLADHVSVKPGTDAGAANAPARTEGYSKNSPSL